MQATRLNSLWLGLLMAALATAAPPGFVRTTIPLDAPPVGLAFDSDGTLWALEGAEFGNNVATLRTFLPDGAFGGSFPVVGDDASNFFVGSMAYDPLGERLLITDNTADGRLYAVSKTGVQEPEPLASGVAGIAGVAVRASGEIFVSTAPFGSAGAVLQVDRGTGSTTEVLAGLDFGAGLAFEPSGNLIVQDSLLTPSFELRGRLQRLPISESTGGLEFGTAELLIDDTDSGYSLIVTDAGTIYATGGGGLYRIDGTPLVEINVLPSQFSAAIAFSPGAFEPFAGPAGGRLAFAAEAAFGMEDMFVTLLTPARPGDYNSDGNIDELDYATWQSAFGSTADVTADGNSDNVVDAADYVLWRKHSAAASTLTDSRNVPEPVVTMTGLVAWAFCLFSYRRRAQPQPARFARKQAKQ